MKTKSFKLNLIAAGLQVGAVLLSTSATAAGFYLHEHSANGLGRAFAGQAALAENATVLYSNAAAITEFDKAQLSAFASYIDPGIDIDGTVTVGTPAGTVTHDASHDDVSPSAVIPAFFYVQPLNDKWSAGIGVFANFGLSTDFDSDFNALHFGDRAEITSLGINPTIAYQVSDELSLGLGVTASFVEAELGSAVSNVISDAVGGLVPAGAQIAQMEGDDWGYSWNLGVLWKPTSSTNIGLSYRSETKLAVSGDLSSEVIASANQSGTVDLDLPAVAELAISQQITDALSIQASANWFGWSSFDVLEADLADGTIFPIAEEHFENNWKLSLGATYELSDAWTVRAGYAYDEGAAVTEHRTLNIPDTDRQWFSAGATYTMDESTTIDFSLLKVYGREVSLSESRAVGPISSTLNATQSSNATILSAQVNYSF
ncbi:long-chain fatty acid transporter [Thalassotalea euphylliae]|uniref:Long-chain fatty acid transporter n=1 Tax=Thalassotalea euphylliae TaxID=1655234 RepID=A0A3E0TLX0_9GAMM|nr:outer membrane protein transport protein [Thalassotalea euphylliae]REL25516.1 long-chain fatty acid transporter [Thalassotalea euphylliae]